MAAHSGIATVFDIASIGGGIVSEAEAARCAGFDPTQRELWRKCYGSRWVRVAQRAHESPRMAEVLVPSHRFTRADRAYMVEVEKAWQLKDITLRRTTLIYDMGFGEAEPLAAALRDLAKDSPSCKPVLKRG